MTPQQAADLAKFFDYFVEIIRTFALCSDFSDPAELAMVDKLMIDEGLTLRFEISVGARGPIGCELWAVARDGATKITTLAGPVEGKPFRLVP